MVTEFPRWTSAQRAELRYYRDAAGIRLSPRSAVEDALDNWNLDRGFFRGRDVLAVGGGTGLIHHLDGAGRAVSLDPLNGSIVPEIAEDSAAEAVTGAGEFLPFSDESFDVVVSANVLDHTANPRTAVDEIRRVLRAGGVFLCELNVFRGRPSTRRVLDYLDRPHPHHFDCRAVQQLLLEGFGNVATTALNDVPRTVGPTPLERLKILAANAVFDLQKLYCVCHDR